MSRYSLRNRSSCAHEINAWEDEVMRDSRASKSLLANKKTAKRMESNLSPSILKKFQSMTTFSPQKPRSLKRSMTSHLLKKPIKNDISGKKDASANLSAAELSIGIEAGMSDADMMPVKLPERYNYEVWEDPNLNQEHLKDAPKTQIEIESDEKENSWRPSAILHAFSPFRKNREERALKALSIASFPEYLQLKGQFFNELGKSFFKKKEKDTARFKATKINLFRNRYQPSFPIFSGGLHATSKDIDGMTDVDSICKIPTPEVAKPSISKSTVMRYSPIEQSKMSAFKSFKKGADKSKETNPFNDTPFNTPRSEFINRKMDCSSEESMMKRNLRPRPTRPPTLFGFSSDSSEDDTYAAITKRRK